MKKKIIGLLICTLLITITVLSSARTIDDIGSLENKTNENHPIDRGWFWYPSYDNYAPSGFPDFDHRQDNWMVIMGGLNGIADSIAVGDDVQYTPYGEPVDPMKPLVIAPGPNCALDTTAGGDDYSGFTFCHATSLANCLWWFDSRYSKPGTPGDNKDSFPLVENYGGGDDHSPENVPCLICEVANHLNLTSDIYLDLYNWLEDIEGWFKNAGLAKGFKITDHVLPSFDVIAEAIQENKTVVLLVQFGKNIGGECAYKGSHYVACSGVNQDQRKIALSDPSIDDANPGGEDHNDAQYVSHDVYDVKFGTPCPNYPDVKWWLPDYWPSSQWDYAVIGYAMVIECINIVPDAPTIKGPVEGSVDTTYTFTLNSIDPDGDDVYYYIKWGDGYDDETTFSPSGTNVTVSHSWSKTGNFTIQVTAKDIFNEGSNLSTLEITIPRYRSTVFLSYEFLFERFQIMFPIIWNFFRLIR